MRNSPKITFGMHNFLCPHVLCENVRPPVSTFPRVRMFMRHLCMYSLGQWSDQRYYVIKHVLSDLRGQALPTAGGIFPPRLMLILDALDLFRLPCQDYQRWNVGEIWFLLDKLRYEIVMDLNLHRYGLEN